MDELGLMFVAGSCATSTSPGLADQVTHPLDDEGPGPVMNVDEPVGAISTGGVTLRGGGDTKDLFLMLQNETNSGPWSIAPVNLIAYLNNHQH
jgi:hypothetical protein